MTLRIGYDLFAGSTQAGTDSSLMGNIQIETAQALKHKIKVQRLSDNYYWNNTTPGWQAGAVAEADELDFMGSDVVRPQAISRYMMKLSATILAGIDADGCVLTAYASGDTPSTDGAAITLAFKPVT